MTKLPRVIVGALIFNSDGKAFLMRSSGKYGDQWIIPGGKVEFAESLITGLKREILEETHLEITNINFCGVRELIEPDRHFVFIEYTADAINAEKVILNNEATEFGWFDKNELEKIKIAEPTMQLIEQHWTVDKL